MKRGIVIVVILLVIASLGAGGLWYKHQQESGAVLFRTTAVQRGDIEQTITASGTLEPEASVDVGSQVTGLITSFGKDTAGNPIDYRSHVTQGQVLATIDTSVYKSEVDAAQAAVDQAKAAVVSDQADLLQLHAKLNQAQRDWDRAQKLGPSDALAQSSYDSYQAAFEIAEANVSVGEAAIVSGKASVASAQAAFDKAQRNLDYCVISCPVDGVVIDRRVNIGQTVVSSLSVSSLFLIAKDLKHMQIWSAVNEADVGHIFPDQLVTFTVDAFPNRKFVGKVGKLRYNALMTNNVVTYTAEINVENDDEALLPYMTANVAFQVAKREAALIVPNAALRYEPSDERTEPGSKTAVADAATSEPSQSPTTEPASPAPSGKAGHHHGGGGGTHKQGVVWIQDGQFAKAVKVKRGITDSVNTEVESDELKEGDQIIIGDVVASDGNDQTVNPFTPKMPAGRGNGGGGGGGGGGRGR